MIKRRRPLLCRLMFAVVMAVFCGMLSGADASDFPRVWTSAYGLRTAAEFEQAVKDCRSHGVDVMECGGGDEATLRERLAICQRHGMKVFIGVEGSVGVRPH